MENVSGQFYLDWMAGNTEIFKIAAGDVITGFASIGWRIIDGHAGNNPIRGKHIRDIQSLNDRPSMCGVETVTVIKTAADFRVSIFKRDKTISVIG